MAGLNGIEALREKAAKLHADAQAIRNRADAEHRELLSEEKPVLCELINQFEATMDEIALREKLDKNSEALAQPQGRKTQPADPRRGEHQETGLATMTNQRRGEEQPGNWGFRHLGENLQAIVNMSRGIQDPRYMKMAALAVYTGESGGEVPLAPDFRPEIQKQIWGVESLLPRLDTIPVSGNSITMVIDNDPVWSNDLSVQEIAEADIIPPSKLNLDTINIGLKKYGVLIPVSEELLEDVANVGPYVQQKAADKLNWRLNALAIASFLGSPATVTVSKGATGAGGAPSVLNIVDMYTRMPPTKRNQAIWLANPLVEGSLFGMVFPGTQIPAYMPPGGISQAPYSTLFGRPIIFSDLMTTAVGTAGDLLFVDPKEIMAAVKTNGVRQDVSTHFYFDRDVTAFRVLVRAGFKGKLEDTVTRPDGTEVGPIISLATR